MKRGYETLNLYYVQINELTALLCRRGLICIII
jgi:hypothetical protein